MLGWRFRLELPAIHLFDHLENLVTNRDSALESSPYAAEDNGCLSSETIFIG